MKRYTVILTDEEHARLKEVAEAYGKPMSKVLRIYLRIGLNAEKPGTSLIIREHRKDKHIFIWQSVVRS